MTTTCVVCGYKTANGNDYENHPCLELTPLEQKLVSVAMMIDFCDHFCCGMTPERCMATQLPLRLEVMGLKIVEIEGSDV